jgi:Uma2 family endonuclease
MQIELVSQPDVIIARWQELVDDPELAKLPYRIETDRFGRTIMSPPPGFRHVSNVAKITSLLKELLPDGRAFSETPVLTSDGIKVPDATWVSAVYARELEAKEPLVLERAPEICVEVLSPSNGDVPTKVRKTPRDSAQTRIYTTRRGFLRLPKSDYFQAANFGGLIPTESWSFSSEKSYSPSRLICCQDTTEPFAMAWNRISRASGPMTSLIFWDK